MKEEFERFGLKNFASIIIISEIIGAIGLLFGLVYNTLLIISSLGFSVLMLAGLVIRIKLKDNIWIALPAFLLLVLNAYIFWAAIN
ncbi:DoxX family protein [Christiangramia echinicola]|uniref:DoxX-like family protein n=1 Tax=Christiangramia echinicola TaxID=279359 RepID=A0A1H1RIB0_9FLAO|nr:DoxX-like family protein [Christiangramia echinicola]